MILGPSSQSLRHVYQKEASRKTGKRGELLQISVAFFDVSPYLTGWDESDVLESATATQSLWQKDVSNGIREHYRPLALSKGET